MSVREVLLGRRLANREVQERKIGAYEGIPAMGLDGFGSSAYGPEAALTVLIPLGALASASIGWVMVPILALLVALFASYWQTVRTYPSSGGAYIVAKDNLGTNASLLAAAALMIDYVLNVAVGISAGVGALVSAIPELHSYILPLCLAILGFVTLMNLRGTLETGRVFAVPTYLFVASFFYILALGVRTLTGIVVVLGVLLAGIACLANAYSIGAMDQTQNTYRSVLSQLASAVVGNSTLYYVAIGSLLCVLVLSANTSFVGFPRLCRTIAQDGFLPRPFAIAGHRLVFSIGILYLAVAAGALLIVFGGITDHLIPLFAVGAFLTFTLSQTAMVVHWRDKMRHVVDHRERRSIRMHLLTNATGAITTGAALVIIVLAKFEAGAWITVVVVPAVIVLLKSIRRYYDQLASRVRDNSPLQISNTEPPIVLVAIDEWNQLADKSMMLALSLSPDVIGIHLTQLAGPDTDEQQRKLHEQWQRDIAEPSLQAGYKPPRLVILQAQYRAIHEPILQLVHDLEHKAPGRVVAVLIPELVKQRWYQRLLHTHRAKHLRSQLLKYGGTRLTIINVPWYLDEPPD